MIIGAVVYLTGYFVIEDFLAFFKWLRAFRVRPSAAWSSSGWRGRGSDAAVDWSRDASAESIGEEKG
jgi:hypothetical protein